MCQHDPAAFWFHLRPVCCSFEIENLIWTCSLSSQVLLYCVRCDDYDGAMDDESTVNTNVFYHLPTSVINKAHPESIFKSKLINEALPFNLLGMTPEFNIVFLLIILNVWFSLFYFLVVPNKSVIKSHPLPRETLWNKTLTKVKPSFLQRKIKTTNNYFIFKILKILL